MALGAMIADDGCFARASRRLRSGGARLYSFQADETAMLRMGHGLFHVQLMQGSL